MNSDQQKKFIEDILVWCKKTNSLTILQFCDEYKIDYDRLKVRIKKYPDVYDAYCKAKIIIANNRDIYRKKQRDLIKKELQELLRELKG